VTDLLVHYDKDFVRKSYPPCISICFTHANYTPLRDILQRKYDISLSLPTNPDPRKACYTYDEIYNVITPINNMLRENVPAGMFTFIPFLETQITRETYKEVICAMYAEYDLPLLPSFKEAKKATFYK
jgi:hypothetical protein